MKERMKKYLSVVIAFCMVFLMMPMSVSAGDGESTDPTITAQGNYGDNNSIHWAVYSDGTLTISGSGAMPDYTDSSNMKSSSPYYTYTDNFSKVVIKDGITRIGNYSFFGLYKLTSVTLPTGVTSIGNSAFYDNTRLSSINIPDSVTSIGSYAFENCKIESVKIPSGVTVINEKTFDGCNSLQSVTIPDTVTSIGDYAFYKCTALTSVRMELHIHQPFQLL